MQQQLREDHPELDIQILGVNERGHELGNVAITNGRSLPWLQDVDGDGDGASDNFMNRWDYEYRDVVIVDRQNRPIEAYNLTINDLGVPANFETLMQKLIDAAEQQVEVPSWTNPVEPLDINGDTHVSPVDALTIINELNMVGARELEPPGGDHGQPPYLDPSGDGFISPRDALMVINRLNEINSVQSAPAAGAAAMAADPPGHHPAPTEAAEPSAGVMPFKLLAAAVDEAFLDHDDDDSPKRRALDAVALTAAY